MKFTPSNLNLKELFILTILCFAFIAVVTKAYATLTLNATTITSDGALTLTPATNTLINGNVGIGTATPTTGKLVISGAMNGLSVTNTSSVGTDPIATFGISGPTNLVEIRQAKTLANSGSEVGRGTIRFNDTIASPSRILEMGFYEFGAGIFSDSFFEAWSPGFSFRGLDNTGSFVQIRNPGDTGGFKLKDDGTDAQITTKLDIAGTASPISIKPNDVRAAYFSTDGRTLLGGINVDDGINTLQVNGTIAFNLGGGGIPKTTMDGTVDGKLLLKQGAQANFSMIQLGGTSSSFPAIKKASGDIHFRKADDSGFVDIQSGNAVINGVLIFGTTAAQSGSVRLGNNAFVSARNAANSADIQIIGVNASNQVQIASGGQNVGIGTLAPTSKLQVVGLPVFANNAAAIAGGLTAGAFYRTGADPDPVMVVH